ncbi:DUF1345 domain-containing protein [Kitasatospora purpeofusca]|uniref:DUF1345 domain-containing protein n=1 Tax=Kitasatospora purpeofusca TaxID=67352 RepID=A0ABZ1UDM1_9ACTN|nr:DUF1345 domain-containing protein [Kitasatospora purpeofusca]
MHSWLSERRRSAVSLLVAAVAAAVLVLLLALHEGPAPLSGVDVAVLVLFAYLSAYLTATSVAFAGASPERIRDWARRSERGTVVQRYLLGSAPGPGVSLFVAAAALVVSVVWRPGHLGSALAVGVRVAIALALVVEAWVCVLVSFAVAFHADNLVEDERALEFPSSGTGTGSGSAVWADYMYFAVSVMTTFGTTDVNVTSREMRRTVAANAVIAFVFNTVTVASLVSALDPG